MARAWCIFLVSTLCCYQNVMSEDNDPLVETNVGVIKGVKSDDGSISMYMGIPFGSVNPKNPFGDALEYPKFDDVFVANDDSAFCPQPYLFNNSVAGTFDCLHLNIYVPASATPDSKLPVMVWIYGGAFIRGFGGRTMFGPDFLVRHDVILVTVSYRVGPYGFMCLDNPEVPGNQGLKDQLMGMRWVKNNIEAFGGDADQITLFGPSAGGHAVELHLRSTKEKLYNKIIMQSASAYAGPLLHTPDREAPIKLAERLGFSTNDVDEALEFLKPLDPLRVVTATVDLGIMFRPCIERDYDGVDNLITSSWIEKPIPKIKDIPILLGFNENEMMFNHINRNAAGFENLNIFMNYLNQTFDFDANRLEAMEKIIRRYYIGDEEIKIDVKWPIIDFDSDFSYIYPVQRTIRSFMESGSGDIFYYMFSHQGEKNFYKRFRGIQDDGVTHADELGYIFHMSYMPETPTPEDQLIIDRVSTMWTNFAKYGNPTPEVTDLIPTIWPPVAPNSYNYLKIALDLEVGKRPLKERMAFWDLFYEMNKEYQRTYEPRPNGRMSRFVR